MLSSSLSVKVVISQGTSCYTYKLSCVNPRRRGAAYNEAQDSGDGASLKWKLRIDAGLRYLSVEELMKGWVVFTDVPIEAMFDGQFYWPYSGSRVVRAEFFRSALRYCTNFNIGVLVSSTYKKSVSDFVTACDPAGSVTILTPREFLETEIGPNTILQSLNCDLRRALYMRSLARHHNWPVVGITHDLSDPKVYDELVISHCGQPKESDAIVCCSEAAAKALGVQLAAIRTMLRTKTKPLQLPIIPHGLDLSSLPTPSKADSRVQLGVAPGDFVFLYFGRICGITKADLIGLLGSFHRVFHGRPNVKLLLAGSVVSADDAYYGRLKQRMEELHLQDQVSFFLNPDSTVKAHLYASADVFVSPASSLQESFGITLLEAMAYEVPIIASNWDGYRDLVVHGQTGFLFPTHFAARPEIDPVETSFESWPMILHQLQDAISLDFQACEAFMRTCERDRDNARDMGRAGRLRVTELFEWKCIMRRYEECWAQLLDMASTEPTDVDPSGVGLFPNFSAFFASHDSSGCLDERS